MHIYALEVTTAKSSRTFDLDRRLTALIGPVGSGKSSLLMLIKHVTGGRAALTPAVRENVIRVTLDLEIEGTRLVLARAVPDRTGIVEVLDPFSRETTAQLPIRSGSGHETISDRLLALLKIPRERVPRRRRGATAETVSVTFANLMAYLYVEATEIDRSIAGHTETYRDRPRRALFEFMFGLNDEELASLQRREGELNTSIAGLKAEVAAVRSFLAQTETPVLDRIDQERRDVLTRLAEASTALDALNSRSALANDGADVLFADIDRLAIQERQLQAEATRRAASVAARQSVIAQLELDLLRAQQSGLAGRVLAILEFAVCPRCFQDVSDRHVEPDQCPVCLQPDPPTVAVTGVADDALRRIQDQIAETRELLHADERDATQAANLARAARFRLHTVRQRVDEVTRSRAAPLLRQAATLSSQHATLLARLTRLEEMTNSWERFDDIERRLQRAENDRKENRAEIKRKRQAMSDARARLAAFDRAFQREVALIGIPGVREARIDPDDYLPRINGAAFEEIQASGGGVATAVHVAYSLALITTGLDDPNVKVPSLLIVDSPQNAIGRGTSDLHLSQRIYNRLGRVSWILGEVA